MAIKFAIDSGHGSKTPGKRTPLMPVNIDFEKDGKIDVKKGDPILEHTANTGVCIFLEEELKRCGITNILESGWDDANSSDDPDVELYTRQKAIAEADCDYVISVHFNASGDGKAFNSAEGVVVYFHEKYPGDSKEFAEAVSKYLAQGTKQKNRGIAQDALAMVNCANLKVKGAILVELGFMTNLREATELMGSKAFWKECAVQIAQGTCEYLGIKYVPEKKTVYKVQVGQAGAFSLKENAEALQKKLEDIGVSSTILTE